MASPSLDLDSHPASKANPARLPTFKIALIDPSLFTLPYDVKLVEGLREIGHTPLLMP